MKNMLYFLKKVWYDISKFQRLNKWWCSILVRAACSQGGPKNPLKGTSMKFLVLAFDAQSGVGAGS